MKLGGSSPGEDTMTILGSMPPLTSSMPVYGFVPQVPESSMKATKAPIDNREASSYYVYIAASLVVASLWELSSGRIL